MNLVPLRRRALAIGVALFLVTVAMPTGVAAASPLTPHAVAGLPGTPEPADIPGSASASGAHCRNMWFPVTLNPDSDTVYKAYGQLCTADPAKLGQQPIQVLIHGGTYNHTYFDWPYKPDRYNYVRHMTQRGFTTLNIDRLGYGYSDHPPSATLNFNTAAFSLHQIVQYLRRGALGTTFPSIAVIGYSMGGLTAQVEAARYDDVDAIATHAVGHHLVTLRSALRLGTFAYPALLDPKFAGRSWVLDPGYVTSIPGRRTIFYGPKDTYDPKQLTYEEKYKDTMAATELVDITGKSYTHLTKQIDEPLLWSLGRYDKIWCGTTDDCYTDPETTNEARYYQPGVFTKYVVPNTGHAALLGYGGVNYMNKIVEWLGNKDIHGSK